MHADFSFELNADRIDRNIERFPVIELVEDRLGDLDYAIVRLPYNLGFTFGLTGITDADAAEGETLCILGHPEGVPKRIEAGPCSRLGQVNIEYDDSDTRGGSSGSGVLADATGLIVGVHITGFCCEELPGTNCLQNDRLRVNSAVRISALLNTSPILNSLAAGEMPSA